MRVMILALALMVGTALAVPALAIDTGPPADTGPALVSMVAAPALVAMPDHDTGPVALTVLEVARTTGDTGAVCASDNGAALPLVDDPPQTSRGTARQGLTWTNDSNPNDYQGAEATYYNRCGLQRTPGG